MNTPESTRYEGNPLVRLLECYTLRVIGQLSKADEKSLTAMEPKLSEIYQCNGRWFEIVASVMEFPENMPDLITDLWQRNQEIAKKNNLELTPQQFAEMFVDQNLS